MSLKKRVKCLICRVLFFLGLKKACNAGPLPTISKSAPEAPKQDAKKPTKKLVRKPKSK